ncbi:T9SS type A sorting domain-containing protein [Taibaiella koreensis]|uniref:T9SS type A sorting domain-containing protein n=1 Tax=Taibaiella koreensis TaxID=1268548 RepID=UPI000E59FF15|nr:T9SS type A sorting domain-containing protein [Taibaiella koreensis]
MKFVYKLSFLLTLIAFVGLRSTDAAAQGSDKITITNQDRTITVYPIPANSSVNVRLSASLRTDVEKVEIINLIGRKLTEQTIIDKSTTDVTFNNLSEMPQGIYMVVARDKGGKIVQSAKMIINR